MCNGSLVDDAEIVEMTPPACVMAPLERTKDWCERWWQGPWGSLTATMSPWIDAGAVAAALSRSTSELPVLAQ